MSTTFNPVFYPPWVGIPPPKTLSPKQAKHLYDHLRTVAYYLDAITALMPQTRDSPVQIGLEPIIAAFIPIVGPFLGAIAGVYIILMSLLFGISWEDVARMVVNIGLDCSVGLVPIVGTVIDTYFKANLANLGILENHIRKTPKYAYLAIPAPRSWWQAWKGRGTATWAS